MLELVEVSKRYGDTAALTECSFAVRSGRLTGFVGPNGAGKTTAMRSVFGLITPDGGVVRWRGRPIADADRRRFGYMPEERGLYPRMRVGEQLVHLGRLSGLTAAAATKAVDRWLAALDLSDRKAARLDDLSHGNQQRVQLVAALLHDPELLVLDEPFSGLDPIAMDAMSGLLRTLAAGGAAVLFSSHQLDVVEHLCEDVVVIDAGHVVLSGELDELRDAAPYRYLDLTIEADARALPDVPEATVVARGEGRMRLRLPRDLDPVQLLTHVGHVVRFAYEPPSLSELFRDAVNAGRPDVWEATGVAS